MMVSDKPKYDAFVSYSHREDGAFAKEVYRKIQRFANPFFASRHMRLFIDDANLTLTYDLWNSLQRELLSSSFLLLLASPGSASSKWVARELSTFATERGLHRVGIVIVGGKSPWTDDDYEEGEDEAALSPEALDLLCHGNREPLVLDFRPFRTVEGKLAKHGDVEGLIASIVSAITGKDKDELYGLHLARLRQRLLSFGVLIISLLVAVGLAVSYGITADRRSRIADSRRLAAEAIGALPEDVSLAAHKCVDSFEVWETLESHSCLLKTIHNSPGLESSKSQDVEGAIVWALGPSETAAYGTVDGKVHFWNWKTGTIAGSSIQGHNGPVTALAMQGSLLASGGADGVIIFWDNNLKQIQRFDTGRGQINLLQFSDNLIAYSAEEDNESLWIADRFAGSNERHLDFERTVYSVAFSPNGHILAVGDDNEWMRDSDFNAVSYVHLIDVQSWQARELTIRGRDRPVTSIAFDHESHTLATGWNDGRVLVWKLRESDSDEDELLYDPEFISRHNGKSVTASTFSPDSSVVASADVHGGIVLWNLDDKFGSNVSPRFKEDASSFNELAFADDGFTLLSAGDSLRIWNVLGLNRHFFGPIQAENLGHVVSGLSHDRGAFYTATRRELVSWNLVDLNETRRPLDLPGRARLLSINPTDGQLLISNSEGIALYDPREMKISRLLLPDNWSSYKEWSRLDPTLNLACVVASRKEHNQLDSQQQKLFVWDLRDGSVKLEIPFEWSPSAILFSPDGSKLAIASHDTVRIVDISAQGSIAPRAFTLVDGERVESLAFHPHDGTLAVGGEKGAFGIWRTDTGALDTMLQTGEGRGIGSSVFAIAFSPSGQRLAAVNGQSQNSIQLWDYDSRSLLGELVGPRLSPIIGDIYFPTNDRLISVGVRLFNDPEAQRRGWKNHEVVFWDLDPEEWVERVRFLDREEN